MFVAKGRSQPYIEKPERCLSQLGSGLTRKHKNRLGKACKGQNTLAYYKHSQITAENSYNIGPLSEYLENFKQISNVHFKRRCALS